MLGTPSFDIKAFVGTHYRGTAKEVRALDTYIKLARALATLEARLGAGLTEEGMSVRQLAVLEALLHLGPLTQSELCSKMLRTGGSVTSMIDHLEGKHLVRRERDAADRRVVRVLLTATGRRAIARVFPRHVASIVEGLAGLTKDEQDELGRLCRKLGLSIR